VPNFSRAQRLVHKPQFDLVYQTGRKLGDQYFLLLARSNDLSHPRIGLSVSARTVGNAVNRNRIKRIIRDSFRLNSPRLPAADIVINSRPSARDASNAELRNSLAVHWINVVKRCGEH
jgi:ribonuclease P protein component